jgi:hypothetical protein
LTSGVSILTPSRPVPARQSRLAANAAALMDWRLSMAGGLITSFVIVLCLLVWFARVLYFPNDL